MAYVGNPIDTQNTFQSLVGKRFNGDGSTTDFTLDVAPGSVLDIEVFVGNVRQDPNSAYTVSGTTLSFTGPPTSGTNNIYVVHQAKSVGTIDVPTGGVAAGSLGTSVLTGQTDIGAAIADSDLFLVDDGAGGTLRKTAASRIKTYAGFSVSDITGATELAATPADTDELIISDAGTLKRIDYSYIKSTGEPFFSAQEASTTSFSDASKAQVQFDTEDFDSGGCYNNTGSTVTLNGVSAPAYSFAPNVAGKYFFAIELQCYNSGGQLGNAIAYISKNGTDFVKTSSNFSGSGPFVETITGFGIAELDGTDDYVTGHVYMDVGTGTPQLLGGTGSNMLMGFKIS